MSLSQKTQFSHNDVEILKSDVLYKGIFRLMSYELKHRLFNGAWTPPLKREVLERYSAAAILPYDPKEDKIVLISQFRPGLMNTPNSPSRRESAWLLEVVAGVIDDPTESPEQVARREAVEEAGCEILEVCKISEYFVSPGCSNEYLSLFCGRIDSSQVGGVFGLAEEHEDILAFSLKADEAFELLRQGQICNAHAIIALQWLQLHRAELRETWLKKA